MPAEPRQARVIDAQNYETVWDRIPLVRSLRDIVRFFPTRQAVLQGEPLYNLSKAELKQRRFLGPWSFNAVESTLAGIPGLLLGIFALILFNVPLALSPDRLQAKVISLMKPFTIPFSLMLITYVVSYSALPAVYVQHSNILGAQRKYLYLDGAKGLWPQLLMSSSLSLTPFAYLALGDGELFRTCFLLLTAIFWVALLWQSVVTLKVVGLELFDYDYLVNKPDTMFLPETGPWGKYMFFAVFGTAICYYVLAAVLGLTAQLLAAGLRQIVTN